MERPPNKLISLSRITLDVRRFTDRTRASAPQQQALGNDVRGVETTDAEGDDVVEGCGGADVDEADKAGDEGCYHDCEKRDCGFGLNLAR